MSVINLVLTIVVVGVTLWALNQFIPMDGKVRSILNAVVILILVIWILDVTGILHALPRVRVGNG